MSLLRSFVSVASFMLCAGAGLAAQRAEPTGDDGGRFDGAWTFEATTTVGSCPALLPNVVDIKGDLLADTVAVRPAANARATQWGYVESDGTIVARFTAQGHVARAHGQLRGNAGSGAWSSSTDMCGGVWKARRGGTERAAVKPTQRLAR
jgi:hypothetical protein